MIEINKDNIKLKYILNLESLYNSYPSKDDIIYFIVNWAVNHNKEIMNFTNSFLYRNIGEQHIKKIDIALDKLVEENIIELKKIKKERRSYILIKNPFV